MEDNSHISVIFFYGWTLGAIFILSMITFFIYLKVRYKSFLYYSLYTSFLNLYLGLKAAHYFVDASNFYESDLYTIINWSVQFIYYLLYAQFVRTYFNFKAHNPRLDMQTKYMMRIMAVICAVFVSITLFLMSDSAIHMNTIFWRFVIYFYIPVFVAFASYALFKASKFDNRGKNYIIFGSAVYIFSAVVSSYFSVAGGVRFPLFFYMSGVLIEFTCFAIALGIKVYQLFEQKNEFQQQLIDQLEANRKLTEYNNKILTDQVELFTKKEIELELKNSISRLQSKVFRSQMNSHFIFNTLNSIKATIINNNKEKSVDQLNKFSKLVRNILNHSLQEIVSLEKEIEITELYTFLENLRLDNQISFDLRVDPIIATNSLKVPPFIIQPFVENSIWHGLAQKEGNKAIRIDIRKVKDKLCICILDNGIGMLKALENQNKKSIQHKSMGIDITKDRLRLFTQNEEKEYELTFENLGSEQNSEGTKVIIELPLRT